MPAALQASISSVPAGAVSFLPSTVKVTSAIQIPLCRKPVPCTRNSRAALLHRTKLLPVAAPFTKKPPALGLNHLAPLPAPSCAYQLFVPGIRAGLPVQVVFKLFPELLDKSNRRHGRRIAQRAEGTAQHVFRQITDIVEVLVHSAAGMDPSNRLLQPVRSFTARNTPSAAFMLIEGNGAQRKFNDAGLVVNDDNPSGAQHRSRLAHLVKIQPHINFIGG